MARWNAETYHNFGKFWFQKIAVLRMAIYDEQSIKLLDEVKSCGVKKFEGLNAAYSGIYNNYDDVIDNIEKEYEVQFQFVIESLKNDLSQFNDVLTFVEEIPCEFDNMLKTLQSESQSVFSNDLFFDIDNIEICYSPTKVKKKEIEYDITNNNEDAVSASSLFIILEGEVS